MTTNEPGNESGSLSEHTESMNLRGRKRRWTRWVSACVLALAFGAAHASADGAHRSASATANATAAAFALDGAAEASSSGGSSGVLEVGKFQHGRASAKATAAASAVTDGAGAWTKTWTQTVAGPRTVVSITKSMSYAADEEGNTATAIAQAWAKVGAYSWKADKRPGRVVTKTSVAVTGNGIATAGAGGSIAIGAHGVSASTWGKTSAEVF